MRCRGLRGPPLLLYRKHPRFSTVNLFSAIWTNAHGVRFTAPVSLENGECLDQHGDLLCSTFTMTDTEWKNVRAPIAGYPGCTAAQTFTGKSALTTERVLSAPRTNEKARYSALTTKDGLDIFVPGGDNRGTIVISNGDYRNPVIERVYNLDSTHFDTIEDMHAAREVIEIPTTRTWGNRLPRAA